MRTKRTQTQDLPWLLARGHMTLASGAAILMVVLYAFQWTMNYFDPDGPVKWFGLTRSGALYGCLWEFVSYPFLHHLSHPFCLGVAVIALVVVGNEIEGIIGATHFAILFLVSSVIAGAAYLATSANGPLLGGQPVICAVIVGCTTILSQFPLTLPLGIQLRYQHAGWTLILVLLGYGLFSGRGDASSTALVNLTGAVTGWVYVRILGFGAPLPGEMSLRQRLAQRARIKQLPLHLYLEMYVDPILEKIHHHGIGSLSRAEKQVLRQARQRVLLKVS
jgi:membrane associated rhomboid family serine protease